MNVLVVVAHADDEVLGCGGTMAKHLACGDQVTVLVLTEGVSSRDGDTKKQVIDRMIMAENSAKALGGAKMVFRQFKDQMLDSVPLIDIAKEINEIAFRPDIVYTHHHGCLNQDHRRVNEAVKIVCRPSSNVKKVIFFKIPSSTEWQMPNIFSPNYFVDVTGYTDKKIEALKCYDIEMRKWPHPRSYEAITHETSLWGAQIGVDCAEAFEVGRIIS